jgi:putative transcriptional regulator
MSVVSALGKRLIKAAKSARAIARGEADPETYRVHVPVDIDVKAVRKRVGLSQGAVAARFGIPAATLRDWEQNRRRPEEPARALLMIIDQEPKVAARALEKASRKAMRTPERRLARA